MQAIIMAAGRGSRLGNLTEDIPKAFLEARGHRLIDYNLVLLQGRALGRIGWEKYRPDLHLQSFLRALQCAGLLLYGAGKTG